MQRRSCRALVVAALAIATAGGCAPTGTRPSILLVVLDTVRVDDVSAYGRIAGTTPTLDGLARSGLRYARAYSNASWTLPSHASLFTGLLPHQHGILTGRNALPDGVPTLAEHLQRAGYETVGVSENPWLSDGTRMTRGFERFILLDPYGLRPGGPDMSEVVGTWFAARRADRPFFLFLNIMDAHAAYTVRDVNPFLPPGVTREAAQRVSQDPRDYICIKRAGDPDLGVLRGLYRGDVQAADAKLGRTLARLGGGYVTVVVSDHGECFGEHGLMGHDIGITGSLLHVPLVVSGLSKVAPAVIETPVQLADVVPSVLAWARAPVPDGLAGRPLPTRDGTGAGSSRAIVSEYMDYTNEDNVPEAMRERVRRYAARGRSRCGPQDRVFGDMRSILVFPHKLIEYSAYSPQLFDVERDPDEEHDLSSTSPERLARLRAELEAITSIPHAAPDPQTSAIDPALAERLRALGYLGGGPREPQ
jgi:arylsulfatase A-like enzyme